MKNQAALPRVALSRKGIILRKDFFWRRRDVAQICNRLYRRIAFVRASEFTTPGGLQIRDTAERNSALLWLGLRRAAIVAICQSVLIAATGAVSAQSLPKLSVSPPSNRVVSVAWPYTNSGFVFQEATNLNAAAWSASTLAPGYNSNSATFSVSAVATNSAKFFRLNQPADLRGIYIYSSDVSSISADYSLTLSNSLQVPGVDGLVLVIAWAGLEPTNQIFYWTNLDFWMDQAVALGKKVDVTVMAGSSIPAWVFAPQANGGGGVAPLNFTVSPHSGMTTNCIATTNAAPWDTNYLAAWNSMLSNLSGHLKSAGTYSNVTLLRLTGINRTTDELRLPAETAQSTGLDCVSNAPAIWQAVGYTPDKLLFGWSNILTSFETYFPDKPFSVAIITDNPFPPIDNSTNIVDDSNDAANQPLLALAGQELPGRLVVQFNFLMSYTNANAAVPAAAQAYGTLTAYQSNNYYGQDGAGAACGGDATNPVPCTNNTYLVELQEGIYPLGLTNSLRSQYIEVFPTNVISFSNAVWEAHSELFGGP